MRLADLESLCSYDRLRELAEADKDGRVAVLPVGNNGAMLDTSYPENPQLMKRVHFAVAYVSKGIVFHQPYNIFLENIAAGYISPLSEEAEKALEAIRCCATSGLTYTPQKAKEAWNRRADKRKDGGDNDAAD